MSNRRKYRYQPKLGHGTTRDPQHAGVTHAVKAAIEAEARRYGVSPSWVAHQRLAISYGIFDAAKDKRFDYRAPHQVKRRKAG